MDLPGATLVFLNNASGKPGNMLRVELPQLGADQIKSIRSARDTKLNILLDASAITLELPLPNTEILLFEHSSR